MLPSRGRFETVRRALLHEVRVERVTFMAGSIAYHAFVSLLPLLLLVLAAIAALGSRSLEGRLDGADELAVEVDGERVALPVPTGVEVDAGGSRIAFVDAPARLRLTWETGSDADG